MTDDDISTLPNLGPKTSDWMRTVGVRTVGDLRGIGSVEAYVRLRQAGFRPTLVALWALEMGLQDRHWTDIREDEKRRLKTELSLMDPSYRKQHP